MDYTTFNAEEARRLAANTHDGVVEHLLKLIKIVATNGSYSLQTERALEFKHRRELEYRGFKVNLVDDNTDKYYTIQW